jgi:hypothetical protein
LNYEVSDRKFQQSFGWKKLAGRASVMRYSLTESPRHRELKVFGCKAMAIKGCSN